MQQICKNLFKRTPLEAEAVPQRCSFKKVFCKYAASLWDICLEEHLSEAVPLEVLF